MIKMRHISLFILILSGTGLLTAQTPAETGRPEEGARTLPGLTLNGLGGNENLLPQYLNSENRLLVGKLTEGFSESVSPIPPPHRLSVDRSSGKTPDDLLSVLDTDFSEKSWESAYKRLIYLLKSGFTEREQSRVYYYMGQCSYFQGNWQRAYLEFLLAEKSYSRESEYWKNIILDEH